MYIVISGQKYGKKNHPQFISKEEAIKFVKSALLKNEAGDRMTISLKTSF